MSNEELAIRIRDGEEDLIPQLWEQVERFIAMKARHYMKSVEERGITPFFEVDDLVQQGYFAMLDAADHFNPDRGGFLCILELCCKSAFAEAAGHRLPRQRSDALRKSVSGDALLVDDGDLTLLDTITDDGPSVEDEAISALYHQQLHEALERALSTLTTQQEKILRRRYYQGETLSEIAEDFAITREGIRQQEAGALRHLYNTRKVTGLNEFLETHTNYYARTGVTPFKHSGMSSVEAITIRREELARRWLRAHMKKGDFDW